MIKFDSFAIKVIIIIIQNKTNQKHNYAAIFNPVTLLCMDCSTFFVHPTSD